MDGKVRDEIRAAVHPAGRVLRILRRGRRGGQSHERPARVRQAAGLEADAVGADGAGHELPAAAGGAGAVLLDWRRDGHGSPCRGRGAGRPGVHRGASGGRYYP